MRVFAIGDLHLSFDPGIDKPMDVFGVQWKDHWAKIEKNWKEMVSHEDVVLILGDISWGLRFEEAIADLNWIDHLPGKKILIKGNHDLWWQGISKIRKAFPKMNFIQGDAVAVNNIIVCGSRGWTCPGSEQFNDEDNKIYKREILRLDTSAKFAQNLKAEKEKEGNEHYRIIGCIHFPPTNDKHQSSGFTEIFSKYDIDTVVYGHLHGKEVYKNGIQGNFCGVNYKLASADYLDFKLFEIK